MHGFTLLRENGGSISVTAIAVECPFSYKNMDTDNRILRKRSQAAMVFTLFSYLGECDCIKSDK